MVIVNALYAHMCFIQGVLIYLEVQCYFYDSDIGGFHYGPGHPYVRMPIRGHVY
jgi:hypothetical protein